MQKPKDFYVYLHRRATDGKVFYVGKGHEDRSTRQSGRNNHWKNMARKHRFNVEFYATGLQEWYAFELEKELIAYYGRENLCNFTDGGEGCSGRIVSEETKIKMAKAKKGRKNTKCSGENSSSKRKDVREKISLAHKGKKKEKLSIAKKGKQIPHLTGSSHPSSRKIICLETGMVFETIKLAIDFLVNDFGINPACTNISKCCKGKRKTAYGYTWKYVDGK